MPEGWLSAGSHHRCSSSPASRAQAGCSAWSLHRYADLYNDDDKKKQNVDTRYLKFFIKSPTIYDFIKKKNKKKIIALDSFVQKMLNTAAGWEDRQIYGMSIQVDKGFGPYIPLYNQCQLLVRVEHMLNFNFNPVLFIFASLCPVGSKLLRVFRIFANFSSEAT